MRITKAVRIVCYVIAVCILIPLILHHLYVPLSVVLTLVGFLALIYIFCLMIEDTLKDLEYNHNASDDFYKKTDLQKVLYVLHVLLQPYDEDNEDDG